MKKLTLICTAIASIFCATNVHAQTKGLLKLGVGPVANLPLGDFGDFTSFGIGGEAQASYAVADMADVFVQSGYVAFLGKEYDFGLGTIKGETVGTIPILGGARFHHSSGFMVGGALGYTVFTGGGSGGGFTYSPQIGYSAGIVDVIAHYTGISNNGTSSMVGLKVFVNFLGGR